MEGVGGMMGKGYRSENRNEFSLKKCPYESLRNTLLQNECCQQQPRQVLILASSILYIMAQEEIKQEDGKKV